jgi:hypothetical protein
MATEKLPASEAGRAILSFASTASRRQRRLAGTDIPVAHPRIKLAQVMADGRHDLSGDLS